MLKITHRNWGFIVELENGAEVEFHTPRGDNTTTGVTINGIPYQKEGSPPFHQASRAVERLNITFHEDGKVSAGGREI